MNAYELADKLETDKWDEATIVRSINDGIKMLRQQADRIAELEKQELNDGGEPVKNATYWKRQYNLMASQNDNLKSGLYHANEQIKYLETHPVKELTDEEIEQTWQKSNEVLGKMGLTYVREIILPFARAILKKAGEK